MSKVIFGRYPLPPYEYPVRYLADAFGEPNYGVFGVAVSNHPYNFFPISEQDVHTAFDLVHAALTKYNFKLAGIELLQNLLQAVHNGFGKIDIYDHIAGLKLPYSPAEIASRLEETMPVVQIILLKLEGRRLSMASVGNVFGVHVVHSSGQDLIFGIDLINGMDIPVGARYPGNFIIGQGDMPEIYSREIEVEPGTFIIVTNITLGEIVAVLIRESKLSELLKTTGCDPEVADRRLRAMLKPKDLGDTEYGLAWAITCVEE